MIITILINNCGVTNSPQSGRYNVTSDCPDSQNSGSIVMNETEDTLIGIFEVNDADLYGFPSTSFLIASSEVSCGSGVRDCKAVVFEDSAKSMLFACKDNGTLICTIHLEK